MLKFETNQVVLEMYPFLLHHYVLHQWKDKFGTNPLVLEIYPLNEFNNHIQHYGDAKYAPNHMPMSQLSCVSKFSKLYACAEFFIAVERKISRFHHAFRRNLPMQTHLIENEKNLLTEECHLT